MKKITVALLLAFSFLGSPSPAETDQQTWIQALAQMKVADHWKIWAEIQPRYSFGQGNMATILLRPGVGYIVSPELSLWAGYGYTPLLNPTHRDEHRLWVQGIYSMKIDPVALSHRLRLEERDIAGSSPWAARLRYQLRSTLPFSAEGDWSLLVADEAFFALNTAAPAVTSGFDQNRLFLGVSHKLGADWAIDFGYLWNAVHRATGPNRYNQTVFVNLFWNPDFTTEHHS